MNFTSIGLKYAAAGLHVFPLVPGGKNPIIKSVKNGGVGKGVWDATIDAATIEGWRSSYGNANIGIHPGPSKMIVLDFDNKGDDGVYGSRPNGLDTLEELRMAVPEIDDAWIVATPTGGWHYYFTAPDDLVLNNPVRIMQGLDIRFNGTFVVAPPSIHPNGKPYEWANKPRDQAQPIMLPASIAARLTEARQQKRSEYAEVIKDESPINERHSTLFSIGGRFRRMGLDFDMIYTLLDKINQKRCRPEPLPEDEIKRMTEQLCAYEAAYDAVGDADRNASFKSAQNPNAGRKKPTLRKASTIKATNVNWLMPGFFAAGKFNVLWGMEGRGKSYLTLGMAALMSKGQPLPGVTELEAAAQGPGDTVFLAFEDDPSDTLVPRLNRCGADMSRIHIMHYEDGTITNKDLDGLKLVLDDLPDLRMVVIDPITSYAAGVNDNDETSVRSVVDPLIRLAFGKKYAIIGIKHSNKKADAAVSDRTSGARAWTGAARCVVLAGHDNEKEQGKFHTFGGLMNTKQNLTGAFAPLAYEIKDGKFEFVGTDSMITPDRLFPKKDKDKKDGN